MNTCTMSQQGVLSQQLRFAAGRGGYVRGRYAEQTNEVL